MRLCSLAVLSLLSVTACGEDDAERPLHASCDTRAEDGQCGHYDLSGPLADEGVQNVQVACAEAGGTYGVTCEAGEAVGSCVVESAGGRTEVWYYPPIFSAQSAADSCAYFGGTFTP